MDSLSLDAIVVASPDQVSSELDGEVVVLNHQQGVYFGLDAGVGALVWRTVQSPVRICDVVAAVLERYDVDEARCTQDVTALLDEMHRAGLIQATADPG
jgi:hypothetical protein